MRNANWTEYKNYQPNGGKDANGNYLNATVYHAYRETITHAPKGRTLIFYDGFSRTDSEIEAVVQELKRLGVRYVALAGRTYPDEIATFNRCGFHLQSTMLDAVPRPYVYERTGETVPAFFLAYEG